MQSKSLLYSVIFCRSYFQSVLLLLSNIHPISDTCCRWVLQASLPLFSSAWTPWPLCGWILTLCSHRNWLEHAYVSHIHAYKYMHNFRYINSIIEGQWIDTMTVLAFKHSTKLSCCRFDFNLTGNLLSETCPLIRWPPCPAPPFLRHYWA